MNRSDLTARIAAKSPKLRMDDVDESVKVILDAIAASLVKGGRAEIRDFGSFQLNYRPPRKSRNPKTGEPVMVPAKYVPHFRVGRELRERVDYK